MSLDQTLLAIRREFSGNEKYKILLQHLNNVETELAIERKKHTELLKKVQSLNEEIIRLKDEITSYTGKEPGFVRKKVYDKLMTSKGMWETRFWEVHAEKESLKCEIQKLKESLL